MTDNLIDSKILKNVLMRAFELGQTYWRQEYTESKVDDRVDIENKAAAETYAKFTKLIEDAIGLLGGQND